MDLEVYMEADQSMEDGFIDLVKLGPSQKMFVNQAKTHIGDDWISVGSEIVNATSNPKLIERFNSYVDKEAAKKD